LNSLRGHPRTAKILETLPWGCRWIRKCNVGAAAKDELYERAAKALQAKPGIPRMLSPIARRGNRVRAGDFCGTQRSVESLELLGLRGFFAIMITGDDVRKAKPAPDSFLLAAGNWVFTGKCVVVEDFPSQVCRQPSPVA